MAELENSKDLISVLWSGADILRSKMDANEYKDYLLGIVFYRVSKIFGGLNFRGQFRGLNFEGHFRGINPKRNRWHSSVSFSIMFYWLCFCEGGNHGSFLSI